MRIDRPQETDAACERGLAGVAQHATVRAQNDRELARVDLEALEQGPRIDFGVGVEPLVRVPVAREEAFQPEHVGMRCAADDHRSSRSGLEQADAAQDQRAHDALAQLRFRHEEIAKLMRADHQGFDVAASDPVHERRAAGELGQLTHERPGTVDDDRRAGRPIIALKDDDLALQDDERPGCQLARSR